MNFKRSDLAMYRVKERRTNVMEYMESYEAQRWNGFMGGIKGIVTFLMAATVFTVVSLMVGALVQVEALVALCYVWGVASGLIFSQCIRNYKNAEVEENLYQLKKEYVELTRMSKELHFA